MVAALKPAREALKAEVEVAVVLMTVLAINMEVEVVVGDFEETKEGVVEADAVEEVVVELPLKYFRQF